MKSVVEILKNNQVNIKLEEIRDLENTIFELEESQVTGVFSPGRNLALIVEAIIETKPSLRSDQIKEFYNETIDRVCDELKRGI